MDGVVSLGFAVGALEEEPLEVEVEEDEAGVGEEPVSGVAVLDVVLEMESAEGCVVVSLGSLGMALETVATEASAAAELGIGGAELVSGSAIALVILAVVVISRN